MFKLLTLSVTLAVFISICTQAAPTKNKGSNSPHGIAFRAYAMQNIRREIGIESNRQTTTFNNKDELLVSHIHRRNLNMPKKVVEALKTFLTQVQKNKDFKSLCEKAHTTPYKTGQSAWQKPKYNFRFDYGNAGKSEINLQANTNGDDKAVISWASEDKNSHKKLASVKLDGAMEPSQVVKAIKKQMAEKGIIL